VNSGWVDEELAGPSSDPASLASRRHSRRLEDKLLVAFHHACDVNDIEVAGHVLRILETMLARRPVQPDTSRRRNMENLVAAHERLWNIRNREG
jgi:hypothetical protein